MSPALCVTWFILVGILLAGYAILDGFDLGLGAMHLFARKDEHRRMLLNAIGPVWDGNEVWLVTAGGALFAAFPEVYATVFSGFYLAFMLLLLALIFRAVAIEFRSKQDHPRWRQTWDVAYSAASILGGLLLGVALGNVIRGLDLGPDFEYRGTFRDLLNPYSLLVGVTTVSLFAMHGTMYGILKTEGELQDLLKARMRPAMIVFILLFSKLTLATLVYEPHMAVNFTRAPILFLVPSLTTLAVANIPREIAAGREGRAFLSSCFTLLGLIALFAIGTFPVFVRSVPEAAHTLTIFNGASSPKTLRIMLVIAILGVPVVLAYTASIYYIFRGKVRLDAHSY